MSTSLESFVNVLKRSGLVDEPVLAKSLDARRDQGPLPTGESFAEYLVEQEVVTSWQAAKLLQGKHKGFFLGKYKLLRLLGKGGMSSVYLAEHVLMRRRCAIKVLPWKLVKDSSYLQRFHREAQAVAALDHPNIVRAYDIDHEKDGNLEIHFLVMEYVEGRNLYDLVQSSGPLPPRTAADYIRQGALGLAHAHQAGMVHRDVKPGNFIVDQHGTVKLMDLGLARVSATEGDQSLTIAHDERVLGTADYLAPEQAVDSHLVDTRADLYSLGCTMYFLLTARPPFNEGTLTQRLLAHQTKEPPAIEELRPDVPESLAVILRKLMVKDREQRYQTAEEVSNDLAQWLSSQEAVGEEGHPVHPTSVATDQRGSAADTQNPFSPGSAEEISTQKIGGGGDELGDFLSSLSDVEPSSGKQSSGLKQPSSLKRSSSRAESGSDSGKRGSDRLQTGSGRIENSVLEPNVAASASGKSSTTSGSVTGPEALPEADSESGIYGASLLNRISPEMPNAVRKYRIPIAAGGVGLLLLIGYLIFSRSNAPAPETIKPPVATDDSDGPKTPEPVRPEVSGTSITVGPQGNFSTITEALNYIKENASTATSGETWQIQVDGGQTLKESISIDNSGLGPFPRGVRVVGKPEDPPRLMAKGNAPIAFLNSVEGFSLSDLIIDCQGQPNAVELQGFMTGTALRNIRFENVEQTGIFASGLSGLIERPVQILDCTFIGKSSSARAVVFEPGTQDTRDINITGCRFLGPLAAGVTINESAEAISFRQNIFFNLTTGVALGGGNKLARKQFTFINNSFVDCQQGIDFQTGPFPNSERFDFQQNLFVGGTGPAVAVDHSDVSVDQITKKARLPQFNWTDQAAPDPKNGLNIFAQKGQTGKAVEFASRDPADPNFLKPTSAELKTAAKGTSEPLKFIGAVSP